MQFATTLRAILLVSSVGTSLVACGGKTTDDPAPVTQASDADVASLRDRWNAAASTVPGPAGFKDFTWTATAFPAPTFRGGSPEAYEAFTEILILFYSTGDNLAYAKSHGLLTKPFSDGLDPAHGGTTYTLQNMTSEIANGGFSTLVRAETAAKLKTFCPQVGCEEH